jgi:hypothetical protein
MPCRLLPISLSPDAAQVDITAGSAPPGTRLRWRSFAAWSSPRQFVRVSEFAG